MLLVCKAFVFLRICFAVRTAFLTEAYRTSAQARDLAYRSIFGSNITAAVRKPSRRVRAATAPSIAPHALSVGSVKNLNTQEPQALLDRQVCAVRTLKSPKIFFLKEIVFQQVQHICRNKVTMDHSMVVSHIHRCIYIYIYISYISYIYIERDILLQSHHPILYSSYT